MKKVFAIKTANGKYVSEIYTLNGLDFEILHMEDAKKFSSLEDAEKFIEAEGIDANFCNIVEVYPPDTIND